MIKCGLIGEKLGHSYSPNIHKMLGDYEYNLYELQKDELEDFLKKGDWTGLNVTIPYKKAVVPFMTELGEASQKTGSVNTIVKREDGTLFGDITDVYGFEALVRHLGICVKNKKTLILGNGGAAAAVRAALDNLEGNYITVSRSGENNYNNLELHKDAEIIVNTTPLGMYPNNGEAAVDLTVFPNCKGVIDIVYNPSRTALLLQAEELGIPCGNGLYMLAAQAKKSAEMFTGKTIPDWETDRIYKEISFSLENIILVGMPACGKSTLAKRIGTKTNRPVFDSDDEITKRYSQTPEQIINNEGEKRFREIETEILADLGKRSGIVIATGGGAVTEERNYNLLHQNGTIIWLKKSLASLKTSGRPISQKKGVETIYRERKALYERFADIEAEMRNGITVSDIINSVRDIKK